ncbi:competence protein ComK [Fictibacillus sp. NRS-1165]|uniref:competence protein ComK n=1 Tax=Fictibacillus sp. NRS-1165 TaxID=3144463 RepID=UPI003D20607D
MTNEVMVSKKQYEINTDTMALLPFYDEYGKVHTKVLERDRTLCVCGKPKTEQMIQKVQHTEVKLFRPPGGTLNKRIINYSSKKGYKIILWSWHQDPKDWSNPGAGYISNHILSNVHNGDIILLHDSGGNRRQTIDALNIVLPELKKRGFKCVTVSELMQNDPKFTPLFPADSELEPFKIFRRPS